MQHGPIQFSLPHSPPRCIHDGLTNREIIEDRTLLPHNRGNEPRLTWVAAHVGELQHCRASTICQLKHISDLGIDNHRLIGPCLGADSERTLPWVQWRGLPCLSGCPLMGGNLPKAVLHLRAPL